MSLTRIFIAFIVDKARRIFRANSLKYYGAARPGGGMLTVAANKLPCNRPVIEITRLSEIQLDNLVFTSLKEEVQIKANECLQSDADETKMAIATVIFFPPCDPTAMLPLCNRYTFSIICYVLCIQGKKKKSH